VASKLKWNFFKGFLLFEEIRFLKLRFLPLLTTFYGHSDDSVRNIPVLEKLWYSKIFRIILKKALDLT